MNRESTNSSSASAASRTRSSRSCSAAAKRAETPDLSTGASASSRRARAATPLQDRAVQSAHPAPACATSSPRPIIYAVFFFRCCSPISRSPLTSPSASCSTGIARVRRRDHLVFDRNHLGYPNLIEKINCAYCSHGQRPRRLHPRSASAAPNSLLCPITPRRGAAGAPVLRQVCDFGRWREGIGAS